MPRLNIDFDAMELLSRAESHPEAAAEAIRLAAKYIRREQPLPSGLKEWIANALDDAALKPAAYRAKALTDALCLTANNRRPAGNWFDIGHEFDGFMSEGKYTINSVANFIAEKHSIDPSTARRYWRKFEKVKPEIE